MYIWFYVSMYVSLCYCKLISSAFHGCKFVSINSVQYMHTQSGKFILIHIAYSSHWSPRSCRLWRYGKLYLPSV